MRTVTATMVLARTVTLVMLAGLVATCRPDGKRPAAPAAAGTTTTGAVAPGPAASLAANQAAIATSGDCPERAAAQAMLPGVRAEQRTLEYWLARAVSQGNLDEPLLSPSAIADHNQALRHDHDPLLDQPDLLAALDRRQLTGRLKARLDSLGRNLGDGTYVDQQGHRLPAGLIGHLTMPASLPPLPPELRVATGLVPIRCSPTEAGFYSAPVDGSSVEVAFDRNLCASARPGEPVQIIAPWPGGMTLARTRYVAGWISSAAPLSPPVPAELRESLIRGPHRRLSGPHRLRSADGAVADLPDGTLLVPAGAAAAGAAAAGSMPTGATKPGQSSQMQVHFATDSGWHLSTPIEASRLPTTARALTRRAVLGEAFRYLDLPYGWGGYGGGRDCSRFILDLFAAFALEMPRNSGDQARAGTFTIDLGPEVGDRDRRSLIRAAARSGTVLLHLPGHIMLYLGTTAEGEPMAIHSLAEYMEPCPGAPAGVPPSGASGAVSGAVSGAAASEASAGGRPAQRIPGRARLPETRRLVGRVVVTGLELGAATSRGSLLGRLTHIVILGSSLDPSLRGVARPRAAAPVAPRPACVDQPAAAEIRPALFVSPAVPNHRQRLRVIAASSRPLDPVELLLVDPVGRGHRPELHRLGGPPFGYWAEIPAPASGTWTALLGDGHRVEACRRVRVAAAPARSRARDGPVWRPLRAWRQETANLFALFVEQLFDYPIEDDRTWPSLQALLADPGHNLLFDHFGGGEESVLKLTPDCADLPYFLRAYFAWKLSLPFGVRQCSRESAGRPPRCGPLEVTSLVPRSRADHDQVKEVGAFISRQVANAVHSASARTHPDDSQTDYYPVPLRRETLRPGVVFADPYGHLLVVAKWIPQAASRPGILVGADAQPDGTVGRRRFWRGTFLFRPETSEGGAGFKEFRPLVFRRTLPGASPRGAQPAVSPPPPSAGQSALSQPSPPAESPPPSVAVSPQPSAGRPKVSSDGEIVALDNDELRGGRDYLPWSDEQNRGSSDDFYDRVDALINPRPLDPVARLLLLCDALDESVRRRLSSVDNGEQYMAGHLGTVVPMPTGHAIFETSGAWEDFATPSRDMRLLIAIDTVLGFPAEVRRRPSHYGLAAGSGLDGDLAALERRLREELGRRRFSYLRSDGAAQELSLADLVGRARELEVAYNPNDCAEIRWGAREGTAEPASCRRRAPNEQRRRMEQYRAWFHERRRPPR